jgi:hypothetical protein
VSSTPAAKKSAKAGNYVRGPQPALYRDPKTGATWSGPGRAPAWIANAKDRSKFLIGDATAGEKKPMQKAAVEKAPAARKAAAKKVGTKMPAKKAPAKKTAPTKKVAVKKVVPKKAVGGSVRAKTASAKNAPRHSVAVPAPVATVESDAELTT